MRDVPEETSNERAAHCDCCKKAKTKFVQLTTQVDRWTGLDRWTLTSDGSSAGGDDWRQTAADTGTISNWIIGPRQCAHTTTLTLPDLASIAANHRQLWAGIMPVIGELSHFWLPAQPTWSHPPSHSDSAATSGVTHTKQLWAGDDRSDKLFIKVNNIALKKAAVFRVKTLRPRSRLR